MDSWSFLNNIWNAGIYFQSFLQSKGICIPSQKTLKAICSLFFVPFFLNIVRENRARETVGGNFSITWYCNYQRKAKEMVADLLLQHQMCFQLGGGKSCNVILWRSHKSDVLGIWVLWRWNSVVLIIYQGDLLPLQFSREAVLGFQLITLSVSVWSVLERSHSLCSDLGNRPFFQASIR